MNADEYRSGIYVYCIIKSPGEKKSFGNIGFGEVYTLEYKNFAPVVSNTIMKKYEVNDEEVALHTKVVEQVMKDFSVLPVAYGMVFKNKKLLMVAMSAGYKAMKKAIEDVNNRVELGVKVFLPKEVSPWNGIDICKSDFLEALKKITVQSKELKLFSERLVMNASFLVEKDKINDFSSELERLKNKYTNLKTQYSGPWAPYNFVDIQILSRKRGGFR